MIALLGPVPKTLVDRERRMRDWRWSPEVRNPNGQPCNNVADFFGGPFFTDSGKVTRVRPLPCRPQLIVLI